MSCQASHDILTLIMAYYLFENDVNVTSNKLCDLFSFSGLNRIVTILIVSKVLKKKDMKLRRATKKHKSQCK